MFDRDILDQPWRLLVYLVAFATVVLLPQRQQHWPVLAVSATIALVGWFFEWRKRRASASWALTSGTVESAAARTDAEAFPLRARWIVEIAYSYRTDKGWHSGFDQRRFHKEDAAESAAGHLRGSAVPVRYNPQTPDQSVLAD